MSNSHISIRQHIMFIDSVRNKMSKKANMVRHDWFTPPVPLYLMAGLKMNAFLNIPW
jgi:hypothetical protein